MILQSHREDASDTKSIRLNHGAAHPRGAGLSAAVSTVQSLLQFTEPSHRVRQFTFLAHYCGQPANSSATKKIRGHPLEGRRGSTN